MVVVGDSESTLARLREGAHLLRFERDKSHYGLWDRENKMKESENRINDRDARRRTEESRFI